MIKSRVSFLLVCLIISAGCVDKTNNHNEDFLKTLNSADLSGTYSVIYYRISSSPGGTETREHRYSIENSRLVSCDICTVEYSSAYSNQRMNCREVNISDTCDDAIYPKDIIAIVKTMTSVCQFNYTENRKCFFGNLVNDDTSKRGESYEALVCFNTNGDVVNYQEQGIRPSIRWATENYDENINWQDIPEWYYKKCE